MFGDEHPEGLGTYSYMSRTELTRFVEVLHVSQKDLLAAGITTVRIHSGA